MGIGFFSFFCRARCIGPILSLVDRGGFGTWLTGNSYTGVHNLSLSWRTTTGRRSPTGKPAQTERGHVHSGVVVLHLTFGRTRWVTRNHLQPVYSPALVLPRMHSCTPERSTLNVPGQKRSGRPRKGRGVPRSALPLRLHLLRNYRSEFVPP